MRLLTKYDRLNITVTTLIMVIAAVVYYITISRILTHQVDKALVVEENEVHDFVALNGRLPQIFKTNHQEIQFIETRHPLERRFKDTVYRDLKDGDLEPGRALYTQVNIGDKMYQVLVVQSKVETEDLIKVVLLITLGLIIALLTALFLVNRVILSRIWRPFYQILHQLKKFSLADNRSISPVNSNIDEFRELNDVVSLMADHVKDDYQTLKAFTENASHELMTPIAVINSKLDSYLQTGDLNDDQSKLLSDIYKAVRKLTRLNRSMLLLAKIENQLITDTQIVDIKELVRETLEHLEELTASLDLEVKVNLEDTNVNASLLLMEVLIGNLISNAIRHNRIGGVLQIDLEPHRLQVINSGVYVALDVKRVFDRFQRSSTSEGTGLGLTLCKQICDNYNMQLEYRYSNELHQFTVDLKAGAKGQP
ncbi:HAMP domain-containing histidine kinase [Mucilaginibacter daejeonensis]|uniref:sensor histidine kinase n=1 Tax=Mucilaginibacter daejeonensis TaxID=398049 RepID=UPI001D1792FD|nr:HAMP domain-containing sensor histidine kinase [Mucilaginibacter daejeonensis]UEG55177.1 HAMP domain-containing histidine kinase [Mucilaginibacter daejeonensis]